MLAVKGNCKHKKIDLETGVLLFKCKKLEFAP